MKERKLGGGFRPSRLRAAASVRQPAPDHVIEAEAPKKGVAFLTIISYFLHGE